jgi:predicted transcriptional regulator
MMKLKKKTYKRIKEKNYKYKKTPTLKYTQLEDYSKILND